MQEFVEKLVEFLGVVEVEMVAGLGYNKDTCVGVAGLVDEALGVDTPVDVHPVLVSLR